MLQSNPPISHRKGPTDAIPADVEALKSTNPKSSSLSNRPGRDG